MSGVVSDASPLIALYQIDQLNLLGTLFGTIFIPPAVAVETASIGPHVSIVVRPLEKPLPETVVRGRLGPGRPKRSDWLSNFMRNT